MDTSKLDPQTRALMVRARITNAMEIIDLDDFVGTFVVNRGRTDDVPTDQAVKDAQFLVNHFNRALRGVVFPHAEGDV